MSNLTSDTRMKCSSANSLIKACTKLRCFTLTLIQKVLNYGSKQNVNWCGKIYHYIYLSILKIQLKHCVQFSLIQDSVEILEKCCQMLFRLLITAPFTVNCYDLPFSLGGDLAFLTFQDLVGMDFPMLPVHKKAYVCAISF